MDLQKLETEKRNKATMNLDEMTIKDILQVMNNEDKNAVIAVENVLDKIEEAIEIIVESFNKGGRLIYAGSGTSGRLGVLDAAECVPTFGVSKDMVVGLIAGGEKAMTVAVEGAEDSKESAEEDLKKLKVSPRDTVVGITASGRTPYVVAALDYARKIGARTVSISNNSNSKVSEYADVPIEIQTGSEVLTGSTRLKAGTSQKIVLNMLSTVSMIKVGKVYQNLMVDVVATNQKLVNRSINMLQEVTGIDEAAAEKVLQEADGNVKTAIVMVLKNVNKEEASKLLTASNGFVRDAIAD